MRKQRGTTQGDTPGTVHVVPPGTGAPYGVVNLFAQWAPGKAARGWHPESPSTHCMQLQLLQLFPLKDENA